MNTPQRIDPAPLEHSLDSLERMRLEMGTEPRELVAEYAQEAKEQMREAAKTADRHGEVELHKWATSIQAQIDDLLSWVSGQEES